MCIIFIFKKKESISIRFLFMFSEAITIETMSGSLIQQFSLFLYNGFREKEER